MFRPRANSDAHSDSSNEAKTPFLAPDDDFNQLRALAQQNQRLRRLALGSMCMGVIGLGFALFLALIYVQENRHHYIPNELYSPAQDAVRYETRTFTSGFYDDTTGYMGRPSVKNNQLWEDLYQAGISKIPIEQAAQLPEKTVPLPNAPGYYVVQLSVFHQLHCLNQIRLKLWGADDMHHEHRRRQDEEDEDNPLQSMVHLDHCIDLLRQSLTCSADISTIVWIWDEEKQMVHPLANSTHTCRDFEAIQQWAVERRAPNWDEFIHVTDPLREEI